MKIKFNSLWIVATVGVFIAGIVVGRISVADSQGVGSQLDKSYTLKSNTEIPRRSNITSSRKATKGGLLFSSMSSRDLESMANMALTSPDEMGDKSLLHVLVSGWAKKDPLEALEFAQGLKRSDLVYEGLMQMAGANIDDALNWINLNAKDIGEQNYLSMAVYEGMAKADPVGAVTRLEQMRASSQRDQFLALTINEWAKQDVHAAFGWIETADLGPQLTEIYGQAMGNYIEQEPQDAALLVSQMEPSESRVSFASQIAIKLAEQDVDNALTWANDLDHESKKYALMSIVDKWASGPDGGEALSYVTSDITNANYKDLFATVAIRLAQQDPDKLAAELRTMNEPDQVTSARQLASVYSNNDPDRGIEWIRSLEPGFARDEAVKVTLKTYMYSNVSEAFGLSESIGNDSSRYDQIREVMAVWVAVDPAAAEQALNQSSALSPEEKQKLLNIVNRRNKPTDYVLPAAQ